MLETGQKVYCSSNQSLSQTRRHRKWFRAIGNDLPSHSSTQHFWSIPHRLFDCTSPPGLSYHRMNSKPIPYSNPSRTRHRNPPSLQIDHKGCRTLCWYPGSLTSMYVQIHSGRSWRNRNNMPDCSHETRIPLLPTEFFSPWSNLHSNIRQHNHKHLLLVKLRKEVTKSCTCTHYITKQLKCSYVPHWRQFWHHGLHPHSKLMLLCHRIGECRWSSWWEYLLQPKATWLRQRCNVDILTCNTHTEDGCVSGWEIHDTIQFFETVAIQFF